MIDQRRALRFCFDRAFQCGNKGMTIKNISETGLCIQAQEKMATGQTIHLEFLLPNNLLIIADTRVVWSRQIEKTKFHRIGLEFIKINADRQSLLHNYFNCLMETVKT